MLSRANLSQPFLARVVIRHGGSSIRVIFFFRMFGGFSRRWGAEDGVHSAKCQSQPMVRHQRFPCVTLRQ